MDDLIGEFEIKHDRSDEPARSVLAAAQVPPPGQPDYNMAPTKQALVVLTRKPRASEGDGHQQPSRQLRKLTWGLVPSWAKQPQGGARMINARIESARAKPAYKKAWKARRALVPARGWYEWHVSPTAIHAEGKQRKQPFFISRADGTSSAFGALYEFWRDPTVADGADPQAWLATFTILTTSAEPGLDRVHDRQPLVLDPDQWQSWLDPDLDDPGHPEGHPPGRFTAYPVSPAVNSSRSQGAALIEPISLENAHGGINPHTGELIG